MRRNHHSDSCRGPKKCTGDAHKAVSREDCDEPAAERLRGSCSSTHGRWWHEQRDNVAAIVSRAMGSTVRWIPQRGATGCRQSDSGWSRAQHGAIEKAATGTTAIGRRRQPHVDGVDDDSDISTVVQKDSGRGGRRGGQRLSVTGACHRPARPCVLFH